MGCLRKLALGVAVFALWLSWMRGTPPDWSWLTEGGPAGEIAFVTSKGLVIAAVGDGLRVWSLALNREVGRVPWQSKHRFDTPSGFALAPDGQAVAYGPRIHRLRDGHVVGEIGIPRFSAIAYSPDGRRILGGTDRALSSDVDDEVVLAPVPDAADGVSAPPLVLEQSGSARGKRSWSFSPDGRLVAAFAREWEHDAPAEVDVWSADSGKLVRRIPVGTEWRGNTAFTSRGELAFVGSDGLYGSGEATPVRIFDAESGRELRRFELATPRVFARSVFYAGISPDFAAVSSSVGQLRVHSLESGALVFGVDSAMADNSLIRFSPDGRYVATGDSSRVCVWELPR